MERSRTPVDAFLASFPDDAREEMTALDAEIAAVMSGHERVLWEGVFWGGSEQHIIGYGSYRYVSRSGDERDWFIVGLAKQKGHFSVYVNAAAADGGSLVRSYADRLGKVKAGSANVTFKRLADVELRVLREMVEQARDAMAG